MKVTAAKWTSILNRDCVNRGCEMEAVSTKSPKLLDRMQWAIRVKHYSLQTEKSYIHGVRRYIFYHNKRHPQEMGTVEVQSFLSYLAVDRRVSASTQNQALNSLVFLYKHVLKKELGDIDAVRARRPKRLPVVLTREESQRVLFLLVGVNHLVVSLLYGSGLRLMECLRLRVKDIDFAAKHIIVRDGKGFKDRVTILPESANPELKKHLIRVKALHKNFLKEGYGNVELPYALIRKYPNAGHERAEKKALRLSGISKSAGCHTMRYYAECRIMPISA